MLSKTPGCKKVRGQEEPAIKISDITKAKTSVKGHEVHE